MSAETRPDLLKRLWLASFALWLGSMILTFCIALIAYWTTNAAGLENALWAATTGGFSGDPLRPRWSWALAIPCVGYAVSGIGLILTTILLVLRAALRPVQRST